MKIVVVGGTGLTGAKLVGLLTQQDHHAVAASPSSGVDAFSGAGLTETLEGASVVVDVSNPPMTEGVAALEFFETSTRNLLEAESATGVGHHVALSIVGIDRLAGGAYFRAKIAQEGLITESSIPYSIVRATQFFEFIKSLAQAATRGDKVRLPPVFFQPVAVDEVAAAIASVAVGPPVNAILEVAGPEAFRLDEVVRQALEASNDSRQVVAEPEAGYFGADVDARTLLPGDDAHLGTTTFEEWVTRGVVG